MDGRLSEREMVKTVSARENEDLLAEITPEEVKEATFSMHPDKAPGPDDLNPGFFQAFWNIVGTDVVLFCQKFLQTGELPNETNHDVVRLIPKTKVPQIMTELRPISLCNVLVRILSKVMVNRLKPCLGSVISEVQSAFVEGRLLTDNAMIAFEVNHYMRRRTQGNRGLAGLKIDISKAYDRLEWGFIRNMMMRFGFHEVWIDRIMTFISTVSYGFLYNGMEMGRVIPTRGVRQGDPISPYIYIMCAEGLSAMLRSNVEAGLIHGCTVARGAPNISHLFFADDCYLFFKATEVEVDNMKRILNIYESISGQQINFGKSTVVFSPNTKGEDRTKVFDKLGVTEIDKPGNYLGMPIVISRNRVATFSFLLDRVDQKLQAWGNKTLSKAGKVLLLKTSAQTVPNFWMSLMLIPLEVCDGIQKKFNAFWWGNNSSNGGIRWLSWDKLCQVKEVGGLGFKKLREFNIAMLAKQAWRLVNNCNLVVTALMKARYYPRSEFLNAKIGSNPSYIWRSILEAQDVVRQGMRRKIGDGKSTLIWQDPWLPCAQNGCVTTEWYPQLEHTTVAQLMDEDHTGLDEEILEDLFNKRDKSLMKQIHIPIRKRDDSWYWLFDDRGRFTVRSCYRKIKGESDCPDRSFWNKVWGLKLPGKVVNFVWRMCRDVLPTVANMITKHVNDVDRCAWCHNHVEDSLHVLFQCDFSVQVWTVVGMLSLLSVMPGDTVLKVTKRVLSNGNKEQGAMFGMI